MEAIDRLEALLSRQPTGAASYSVEHLYEVLHPGSLGVLAEILTWLTEHRYMDRVYRVISPHSGAGLAEYSSLREIPSDILDSVDTGETIRVTDQNIEILYRPRV